jgi:PPP family 3-phenylpropionic acid transporter
MPALANSRKQMISAEPSDVKGGRDLSAAISSLPVVAFMALYFMGNGAQAPYLQLYFQERGISAVRIGVLTGVGPALAVVMPLVWGVLGDRSRRARSLLAWTTLLSAVAFACIPLFHEFSGLLLLSAIYAALSWAGSPLSTALVLGEANRLRMDYGSLRLWGSVGYAIGILGAGVLVRQWGTVAIFAGYAIPTALCLLPLFGVHETGAGSRLLRAEQVTKVLREPRLLILLVVTLLWRITAAPYYAFFTIYLHDLGATPLLISIAWGVALVGEITVLRLSGDWARRFGVDGLLLMGLLESGVRWLAFGLVPGPAWAVPFQLLQGSTFGALGTAAVLAVDRIFPPELRATGQGVLSVVMWGIGGLIGSVLAGVIYQDLGGRTLFILCGIGGLLVTGLAYVTHAAREPVPMVAARQ